VANEKELVASLLSSDWETRAKAESALYNASQDIVPDLVDIIKQSLDDKNRSARRVGAWIVYKIGIRITNSHLRTLATAALVDALKDGDEGLRKNAAWGLSAIGSSSTAEPLKSACQDKSADVRDAAQYALQQVSSRA